MKEDFWLISVIYYKNLQILKACEKLDWPFKIIKNFLQIHVYNSHYHYYFKDLRAVAHLLLITVLNIASVKHGSPLSFLNWFRTKVLIALTALLDSPTVFREYAALTADLAPVELDLASCSLENRISRRAITNFLGWLPMCSAWDICCCVIKHAILLASWIFFCPVLWNYYVKKLFYKKNIFSK